MKGRVIIALLVAFLLITFANNVLAQKIKSSSIRTRAVQRQPTCSPY